MLTLVKKIEDRKLDERKSVVENIRWMKSSFAYCSHMLYAG